MRIEQCGLSTTSTLVSILMFDRRDHPSVPTCLPQRVAANGGQGWPYATASAARSVIEGRSAAMQCLAQEGSAFGRGSHFRFRASLQFTGSGSGKPLKKVDRRSIRKRDHAHKDMR